jgi:hypothetical protein
MSNLTTHGICAVPFRVRGDANEVRVYAHHSGGRWHWAYSPEATHRSYQEWMRDAHRGCFPTECVGTIDLIPIEYIDREDDEYVG